MAPALPRVEVEPACENSSEDTEPLSRGTSLISMAHLLFCHNIAHMSFACLCLGNY